MITEKITKKFLLNHPDYRLHMQSICSNYDGSMAHSEHAVL